MKEAKLSLGAKFFSIARTFICLSLLSTAGFAAQESSAKASPPKAEQAKKNRELSFDDLLVQGKYQMAREAVVTVEEDKALNSLLGLRKDFKDRIKISAGLDDESNN